MPKRSTASSTTLPPPIKGWNTRDPISGMDPIYALEAENFVSNGGAIDTREGTAVHATGMTATFVNFLQVLNSSSGSQKLVATVTNTAYNVTSSGVAVNLNTAGVDLFGSENMPVNFAGKIWWRNISTPNHVAYWDGITATVQVTTGPSLRASLIAQYRSRLYFAERDVVSAGFRNIYYGGVGQVLGFAGIPSFDVGLLFTNGGTIAYIGSFATGGAALEENFIVISSTGEILLFQGDNPGSANWILVNRVFIGQPASTRAFIPYSQDLFVLTAQGVVSVRKALQSPGEDPTISNVIKSEFKQLAMLLTPTSNLTANCAIWWEARGLLVFNILLQTSPPYSTYQIVYDLKTDSWWKWTGVTMHSMAILGGELYFGTINGKVFKMTGESDEDPANPGAVLPRTLKLRPAYNYFGNRSESKQFVEARPFLRMSQGLSLTMAADVDYNNIAANTTVSDLTDTSYKLYTPRVGLQGIGRCASIRIDQTVTTKKMRLEAIEVLWNDGDV